MSDGSGRPRNGNGDPRLVRRFVLRPNEVDDAAEPAHTWPPPPRHAPAHRAKRSGAGTTDDAEPTAIGSGTHTPRHAESHAIEPTSIERGTTRSTGIVLPGNIAGDEGAGDEGAGDGPSRRRVLLIAGLIVLVAIALAAAGIGVIRGGRQGTRALPSSSASGAPSASSPGAPVESAPGAPGTAPGETTPGATSGVPGPQGVQGPGQAGPGSGARNGPSGQGGQASAATGISRTMLATAAESSPPAESRTGAIRTDDNRCLDLPGGKPRGHNKYARVATCDGTHGQTWTLDADGTIRLGGKCALAEDSAIRITGCGHRREAQWRAGPGGILLNVSTSWCLTDRGDAVIAPCTGAADQRWTLP